MNVEDKFEEQIVLGGPMLDQTVLSDVASEIASADFYHPAHEVILDAMNTLDREGKPVDVVTVGDHLERTGDLSRVGGRIYLHECVQAVPAPLNAPYYAQIVRDKAHRRSLQGVAARLQQSASQGVDVSHALEIARREIDTTSLSRQGHVRSNMAGAVAEALESLSQPIGLRTPWRDLNRAVAGWIPGFLYVAGARPGVGKTTVLTNAALHAARLNKGTVLVFSLEQSKRELSLRMMADIASVSGERILHRSTRGDDDDRLAEAGRHLSGLDLVVIDGPHTADEIRSVVRDYQKRAPVSFVGIDYLQKIKDPGYRLDEHLRIARDAEAVKEMAEGMDVPVLALAQLNRDIDSRTTKMPELADLKGSSGIEAAADFVLLMHRVNKAQEEMGSGDSTELEIFLGKNRHGPQAMIRLKYDGEFFRITDWLSLYEQRLEQ